MALALDISHRIGLIGLLFLGMGCNGGAWQRPQAQAGRSSRPTLAQRTESKEIIPAGAKMPAPDTVRSQQPDLPVLPTSPTTSPDVPADDLQAAKLLYRQAADQYARLDSYIVRFRRREVINGRIKPEELILMKFRKQPWSIYFKWIGAEGKGREVIYVKGMYDNKIHTLLAAGDMPLMPAGKRIALAPDNPLVKSSSRHSITEAGVGALIDAFGMAIQNVERNPRLAGTLRSLGQIKRPELGGPFEGIEQIVPPGVEPELPEGGKRYWFFDPVSHLPTIVTTQDATGKEVEYYHYDRFLYPVNLDAQDFDPNKLGTQPERTQ